MSLRDMSDLHTRWEAAELREEMVNAIRLDYYRRRLYSTPYYDAVWRKECAMFRRIRRLEKKLRTHCPYCQTEPNG